MAGVIFSTFWTNLISILFEIKQQVTLSVITYIIIQLPVKISDIFMCENIQRHMLHVHTLEIAISELPIQIVWNILKLFCFF